MSGEQKKTFFSDIVCIRVTESERNEIKRIIKKNPGYWKNVTEFCRTAVCRQIIMHGGKVRWG